MLKIVGGLRQTGRSTALIERAYLTGGTIIVTTHRRKDNLRKQAKFLKYDPVPRIMTYDEYVKERGAHTYEILIDDVEDFIQRFFNEPVFMAMADINNVQCYMSGIDLAMKPVNKEVPSAIG